MVHHAICAKKIKIKRKNGLAKPYTTISQIFLKPFIFFGLLNPPKGSLSQYSKNQAALENH